MRQSSRKLLARSLIALVALLLLIQAASFRWWSAYHTPRTSLHLEYGSFSVINVGADRNLTDMGLNFGRNPFRPHWNDLLADRLSFPGYSRYRLPLWPFILFSVAAALWAHRRARPRPGRCPECRYDLRAIPPGAAGSITCPECGRTSAPPQATGSAA